MGMHAGRSWAPAQHLEKDAACTCPKEPCGLVDVDKYAYDCPHHQLVKTIRQSHPEDACPADRVFAALDVAIADLLYYSRKEDEDCPVGYIEQAILDGYVDIDNMTERFDDAIRQCVEEKVRELARIARKSEGK